MVVPPAGREAHAAIAHHRRGDAVLRGGRDVLAPGDLAIIMRVDVDKARGNQLAAGVDLFLAVPSDLADLADAAVLDGDIAVIEVAAASVGNRAAADHEVMSHRASSRLSSCVASSVMTDQCQRLALG